MTPIERYCKTGNVSLLLKLDPKIQQMFLDAAPYAIEKFKDSTDTKGIELLMRAHQIIDVLGQTCDLRGLTWTGNSCYLDSALVALLAVPSDFVNKNILYAPLTDRGYYVCGNNVSEDTANRRAVQQQLVLITHNIRTGQKQYCTNLRTLLMSCPDPENYHDTMIKDSGEFLTYILQMFPTNVAVKSTMTFGTNNFGPLDENEDITKTSTIIDENASIIQFVDSFDLEHLEGNPDIYEFLTQTTDSGELSMDNLFFHEDNVYHRRISITQLVTSPYIIFRLQRNHPGKSRPLTTSVNPIEVFIHGENKYTLRSIVVFRSLHYTCYLKCGDIWYYYDDTSGGSLQKIGSYDKMLKSSPIPYTQGTLYFYVRVEEVKLKI